MSFSELINNGLSSTPLSRASEELSTSAEFALQASDRTYDKQFFSMYQYRLTTLKERVDKNALKKWGDGTKKIDGKTVHRKDKILDITSGEICWVSGTVFSDLHNKLNILKDVEKGVDDTLPNAPSSYLSEEENASSSSVIMLEDESGRAILHNDEFLKKNILVTGCIVAVLGIEVQAGIFEIMDVIYPTVSPQRELKEKKTAESQPRKIAFVSGLEISTTSDHLLSVELLKQYLAGELGSGKDSANASHITRLVIAGNSIRPTENDEDSSISTSNFGSKNVSNINVDNVLQFDNFVSELLPSVPVTILPGSQDPGEICLPQQPIHKAFLQQNKGYVGTNNLQTATNPTWLEDETSGLRILGTSGQNIDDIKRYLSKEQIHDVEEDGVYSGCNLLQSCIKWQIIAPTAPDTLYCYPFSNSDPFTLSEETPHVFFAGNQEKFCSERISLSAAENSSQKVPVQLISIPKFSETKQLVVLDIDTLECETITF